MNKWNRKKLCNRGAVRIFYSPSQFADRFIFILIKHEHPSVVPYNGDVMLPNILLTGFRLKTRLNQIPHGKNAGLDQDGGS